MGMFQKLFGKHVESAQVLEPPQAPNFMADAAKPVDRDLFIEPEAPARAGEVGAPSRLKKLAAQDLVEVGRQAGFEYHDMDMCRQMQERIKAEIVRALDDENDKLGFLIGELDGGICRLQGEEMATSLRAFESQREQIERHRMKLHEQQMLIAGNAGYVELPLTSFATGFKQGYAAYLDATLLMTKYQG